MPLHSHGTLSNKCSDLENSDAKKPALDALEKCQPSGKARVALALTGSYLAVTLYHLYQGKCQLSPHCWEEFIQPGVCAEIVKPVYLKNCHSEPTMIDNFPTNTLNLTNLASLFNTKLDGSKLYFPVNPAKGFYNMK